mgnify:CR=1 FL=1
MGSVERPAELAPRTRFYPTLYREGPVLLDRTLRGAIAPTQRGEWVGAVGQALVGRD